MDTVPSTGQYSTKDFTILDNCPVFSSSSLPYALSYILYPFEIHVQFFATHVILVSSSTGTSHPHNRCVHKIPSLNVLINTLFVLSALCNCKHYISKCILHRAISNSCFPGTYFSTCRRTTVSSFPP